VAEADSRLGNKHFRTIDTSIIHDTLAVIADEVKRSSTPVIANEVKQSSETKMHFV
jgi:hypothetical protein